MYTDIDLDKPRRLRFDIFTYRDMQNASSLPLGDVVSAMQRMGINEIVLTLWGGLKHDDKTLTQSLVAKILNDYVEGGGNIRVVIDALNTAINESGLFKNISDPETEAPVEGNARPEPIATTVTTTANH